MSGNYPDPEVWPDDDPDQEPPSKTELAWENLTPQEFAEWEKQTGRRR